MTEAPCGTSKKCVHSGGMCENYKRKKDHGLPRRARIVDFTKKNITRSCSHQVAKVSTDITIDVFLL